MNNLFTDKEMDILREAVEALLDYRQMDVDLSTEDGFDEDWNKLAKARLKEAEELRKKLSKEGGKV